MDDFTRSVRYAARALRRTPGFTTIAVLTLTLGFGLNTAMFSVVYGIVLRPLPYERADRVVLIQREQDMTGTHRPVPMLFSSSVEIEAWRSGLHSFSSIAVYSAEVAALATESANDVIDSAVVSDTFSSTLGRSTHSSPSASDRGNPHAYSGALFRRRER
jgi:putative ABC transport system permease protein